jgi:hypothetical protein
MLLSIIAALAAQSSAPSEVHFTTSPLGNAFYYEPASAQASADGKTGRVAIRIIRGPKARQATSKNVASSTGFMVFDCVSRTYEIDKVNDFDDAGQKVATASFPILIRIPPQPVLPAVEPVYATACPKR